MADSSVQRDSISHTSSEPTGNIYDLNCIKCSEYESQLCEVLNELGSARKIIEILQKELSIYSPNNVCGNALVQSKVIYLLFPYNMPFFLNFKYRAPYLLLLKI